jgi:hypothetical protein
MSEGLKGAVKQCEAKESHLGAFVAGIGVEFTLHGHDVK